MLSTEGRVSGPTQRRGLRQIGMTLLELLVVLVILGIVGGIFASNIIGQGEKGKVKAAKVQIEQFGQLLDMYKLDVGHYPSTSEGLQALVQAPAGTNGWNGPYLKKENVPKDPWNNDYKYTSPGQHGAYDIVSLGSDGREGGEGDAQDIASWQ